MFIGMTSYECRSGLMIHELYVKKHDDACSAFQTDRMVEMHPSMDDSFNKTRIRKKHHPLFGLEEYEESEYWMVSSQYSFHLLLDVKNATFYFYFPSILNPHHQHNKSHIIIFALSKITPHHWILYHRHRQIIFFNIIVLILPIERKKIIQC